MQSENILYEVVEGRARITLNRPEKRNALSDELLRDLEEALWEADDDTRVHAVIIRGAGSSFCAGYDLAGGRRKSDDDVPRRTGRTIDDDMWNLEKNNRRLRTIFEMHKPSIAQVHGHCLAGGTDVALYCDMVIAAEDAKIGFPPARNLGALPNNMWVYHCGPQWAKRLNLTGDVVSGADAAKIGLVLKAVPAELLEGEVEQLADRLALIDPDLLSANKRIINAAMELMGSQVLQRLAAENDARGHRAPGTKAYFAAVKEKGLKGAFADRDAKFGDGRARVDIPEVRDERGYVIEPED
ncbi:MAG: enoyl-CoA hydratase [bacterium TMED88]|nr:enoyl-CoA hydratase [Deltaproteobacteria bacterium]MDG2049356.1 crotonase/enoyl-CoA hydratase family protein [Myxococcota bacterium]OUV34496.1 MAG: enoyl-CoA hydratase [bacterium TMED88]